MENVWKELKEAATALGCSESHLRKQCNTGKLAEEARQTAWGIRTKWQIHQSYIDRQLGNVQTNEYKSLVERWKSEQLNVYKLTPGTVERNYYGLRSFWRYLAGDPDDWEYKEDQDLNVLTVPNIRKAISQTAKAENIYKSTMSFYNFLIREGLRSESEILRFKEFKPAKNKNPKRTFLRDDEVFQQLLTTNSIWETGRTEHDILLTGTILQLGYHTGLRNQEMCNLLLEHVSLKHGFILVYKGKGDKTRKVGIKPELAPALKNYLDKRPKSKNPHFLVQSTGGPMNRRTVWRRIKNLGDHAGIPIKPHGLRTTFITHLLLDGVPSAKVQKIAGHEHLTTTELYDMSSDEDALDVLRGKKPEKKKAAAPQEIPVFTF